MMRSTINFMMQLNLQIKTADILNLPVLEPISNENVALLYRLITLPKGSFENCKP